MFTHGCAPSSSSDDFDLPEIATSSKFDSTSLLSPQGRHERPTECLICGIPARGYHYDVPSCNGCKTFFRRTCISERNFVCKLNKDCFDLSFRTSPLKCRSCRYEKCISVGMNPLAMKVDEQSATSGNFQKLVKREIKREVQDEENEQKQVIKVISSKENQMKNVVDMLTYLEGKLDQFRKSAYNPSWNEIGSLEYLIQTGSRICMADRCGPMQGWPLKPHQFPRKPHFKPKERPMGPPPFSPDRKHWFFFNLLTAVEYAKTFMFFHDLEFHDRFLLTRHVALACSNLLVSFFSFTKKREDIVQPDGSDCSPFKTGERYHASVMSVEPLIRYQVEYTEYILLKAICLCNPAIPGLSYPAQDILSKQRKQYADTLFDHCLRNRSDGPGHFAHLLSIIEVLERQQKLQKDHHFLFVKSILANCPKEAVIQVIEDIMDD